MDFSSDEDDIDKDFISEVIGEEDDPVGHADETGNIHCKCRHYAICLNKWP